MHLTNKALIIIISILLLNTPAYILNAAQITSSTTIVYVDPDNYKATHVGENVTIYIKIYMVFNLTAYEFKLRFNTTLLKALSTSKGNLFPPQNSTYTVNVDNAQGIVSAQVSLQPGQTASGSGTLLSITFNATYGTPYPLPMETCTLEIFDDHLYGTGTPPQTIPHTTLNGIYQSPYLPPLLSLTLNTDRGNYYFDEKINLYGNLYGNNYPIPDALIALEIYNPHGTPVVARTLPTSAQSITCPIEILSVTPCNIHGTPKYDFQIKTIAYFKISIKNNDLSTMDVTITVNPYDSNNASLGVAYSLTSVPAGDTTTVMLSVPIESNAMSGNATVYANVFSSLVKNGGIALAMEKSALFTISGSPQGNPTYVTQPEQGAYATILRIPYKAYSTGNYTIYTATSYRGSYVAKTKQIPISIAGDINRDGVVNLSDLTLLAKAYGSTPGNPKWSPQCDINRDGAVNLPDLTMLAKNYGKGTT